MNLEGVTAVIRPRAPWESVDLGFRMVLAQARLVYSAVALVMLPIYAGVVAVAHVAGALDLSMLFLWWLKPVLDRVVLHILGHSLFSNPPRLRSTLRQAPRLALSAGLLQALTVYRFDPARSLNLPVWQLEKLRGARRWRRAHVLHRDTWAVAMLLTLFCASLELVAMFSIYAVIALMIPPELGIEMQGWLEYFYTDDTPTTFSLLHIAIYAAVICLVEPLFVGGGFALYLNRRTILEAWDIELAFRRLATRFKTAPVAALIVCLWVPALLATPGSALAQSGDEDAAILIGQVLQHPDFTTHETVREWVPHYPEDEQQSEGGWRLPDRLLAAIARSGELLIWTGVLLLAALLWLQRQRLREFFRPRPVRKNASATSTGRQVPVAPPPTLPDDIPAEAARLWSEQHFTAAISLLYRGALNEVRNRHAVSLGDDATERDWLHAVQQHAPAPVSQFFSSITRTWQYAAYGRRKPSREELLALCRRWPQHFGPA